MVQFSRQPFTYSDHMHKIDNEKMLEFLIDNIFVVFGNQIIQQTVGVLRGTNCAPF
jgi:hypothetical protein